MGGASLDPDVARRRSWPPARRERPERLPGRARRLGTRRAGARATPSSWPTRRCSTSSGTSTRTPRSRRGARPWASPEGQMGNSEVGHLNLGAGAVVKQDITRIDDAVEDGSLRRERGAARRARRAPERGRLHLLGLVSDGGVHASMEHLRALVELAAAEGVPDIVIHAFTDGRDTSPDSGAGYLAEVDGWERRTGGHGQRALLRHGPRPALGPHQARLGRDRARARPSTRRRLGGGRGARRLRARRDRRVHPADAGGGGGRASATATPSSSSTSAPTAPARSRALARRLRRVRPAASARGSRSRR